MNVLRKKGISGSGARIGFPTVHPIQPVILAQVSLRLQKRWSKNAWRLHFPRPMFAFPAMLDYWKVV
jgi:hypothetical protein